MKENLKETVDLFVNNKEAVQKAFAWDSSFMSPICALEYSAKGLAVDVDRMKEAEALIKKKVGAFSEFRGNVKLALAVQMAQASNMEVYFDRVQKIYGMLKTSMWVSSDYYIIAAMLIVQHGNDALMTDEQYVEKAKSIYTRMKENHPWITSSEDIGFATLLAVSGLDEDAVITEMETCFNRLKEDKKFGSANGIQSLSHVLSLEVGNAKEKCDKVVAIFDSLKAQKKKYGFTYELSTLGGLAFTDVESEILAKEIADVDDYLKTKKGFGTFGIGGAQRLMYAAIIVMQQYRPKDTSIKAAALTGVVSLVIAEQVAMMAAITACMVSTTTN